MKTMFFNPGILYMLVSVGLSAVAVVVYFHASHLSLPLPKSITFLAMLLPIMAFLNAYIYPNLLLRASSSSSPSSSPQPTQSRLSPTRLAPLVLQASQALLTAVLATAFLLRGLVPSPLVVDFLLDARWNHLFLGRRRGDAASPIELVQDSFDCCGFRTLDDRAFPFDGPPSCADEYHRVRPCRIPWARAMQATSAIDFAVVLTVGLMQLLGLLLMRERTAWWTALRTQNWKEAAADYDNDSQPLLPDDDDDDDDDDDVARRQRSSYGALLQASRPEAAAADASRRAVTR
ncbi:hypothetical protein L249_7133 [Ophiocordyceps polyrhachis-furcata BCC 54312]|uniref:Tetraspanin Tsp3 n=1 Tax=Ophiocordyceps polyrhachis-furcata BCC 54312 TaxID=1330021 RepID=A0A367LAB7_9HYPO|nr:hypothetical protein L249_7133 [Ophiocordyceps polyrhachis-furcata BCC 54312]